MNRQIEGFNTQTPLFKASDTVITRISTAYNMPSTAKMTHSTRIFDDSRFLRLLASRYVALEKTLTAMKNKMTKYTSEEILQILIDFYNCQSEFDPEVEKGEELTFNTTIADWRMICDLIEPKKLAKYHYDLFKLQTPISDLENILNLEEQNKLREFCDYIAENASKEKIAPIISMGKICMTGAIFKTLISNLKNRGIKTDNIKPSSEIIPLFNKFGGELLEEVNKLAPGSLTRFKYRDNLIVRTGWSIVGIFILLIIFIPLIWQFHWSLLTLLVLGLLIIFYGNRFKPEKEIIGGYNTIRDLIIGIQGQINETN